MAATEPAGKPRRWYRRTWLRVLLGLVFLIVLGWCLRYPLLRALGGYLQAVDRPVPVKAVYVLGGAPFDRGQGAAELYHAGMADVFVFTGGPPHQVLGLLGVHVTEAELGSMVAQEHGLPEGCAELLSAGTSTMEEALLLLEHAERNGLDSVMVLTTEFHARRVGKVFKSRFAERGITVLVHGVPDHRYNAARWWESEEGLLMVNNEYVKLLYYALRY